MSEDDTSLDRRVLALTTSGSALLCVGLAAAYWLSGSELALAHAADSGFDTCTALVLAWTVHVASQPEDESHPFGHSRAEPLGALFVAFLAGALAFEVARDAVFALLGEHTVSASPWLWVMAVKGAFKLGILALASGRRGPAMQALRVDARNDVATTAVAGLGLAGAMFGQPDLDAWLAIPVAAWIAWSGFDLARDNVRRLMGESPPRERLLGLEALARGAAGVQGVHDLRAHYLGTRLHVHLHVLVNESLTVKQAHDIGEAVRRAVEAEEDVAHCAIHIDVEPPEEDDVG